MGNRCIAVEEKGMRIGRYTKKMDRLELVWEGRKKFRLMDEWTGGWKREADEYRHTIC
jgi:hypothetical protein